MFTTDVDQEGYIKMLISICFIFVKEQLFECHDLPNYCKPETSLEFILANEFNFIIKIIMFLFLFNHYCH